MGGIYRWNKTNNYDIVTVIGHFSFYGGDGGKDPGSWIIRDSKHELRYSWCHASTGGSWNRLGPVAVVVMAIKYA